LQKLAKHIGQTQPHTKTEVSQYYYYNHE
jgi:hypothetical protein